MPWLIFTLFVQLKCFNELSALCTFRIHSGWTNYTITSIYDNSRKFDNIYRREHLLPLRVNGKQHNTFYADKRCILIFLSLFLYYFLYLLAILLKSSLTSNKNLNVSFSTYTYHMYRFSSHLIECLILCINF